MATFFIAVAISGLLCAVIVGTKHRHRHISGRRENYARHEIHAGEIPRIGGLAVFSAGIFGLTALSFQLEDSTAKTLWSLWACLSMITMIGLYEDVRRNLPPLWRYIGTVIAISMFSIANGGIGIDSVDIRWLDAILSINVFSILFFVFAVTGATHAFNLIDGQNGLSAGVATLCFIALATVALSTGQQAIGLLALMLAGANLGFLLFNYPFGRIFLGDCGAYLNGASVGAFSVLIVRGSDGAVSPWFALTLLIYPAWETLFSMIRRKQKGKSILMPDARHLHHLYFVRDKRRKGILQYSSAPRLLLLASLPIGLAVYAYSDTSTLMLGSLSFIALYSLLYTRAADIRKLAGPVSSS